MPTVFFSYSHKDETLRNELENHLSQLKRSGRITAWHDRRITAGSEFAGEISENLENADVILLLVSSDFLASDYCYDLEMGRAMEKHEEKSAKVIPIILRDCDWHDAPFGKLLATPTDGKAVTKWPNQDEAFLNVVNYIKDALPAKKQESTEPKTTPQPKLTPPLPQTANNPSSPRSSNLALPREFSQADKDDFRDETFEYIATYFENSLSELEARNPEIQARFKRIDAIRFTAEIYRNGKSIAKAAIRVGDRSHGRDYLRSRLICRFILRSYFCGGG